MILSKLAVNYQSFRSLLAQYNFYIIIAGVVLIVYFVFLIKSTFVLTNDFKCYYVAAKFLQQFSIEKLYNYNLFLEFNKKYFLGEQYTWFYPPHYVFYIYGLGFLPFQLAHALFLIFSIILFFYAIYIIFQRLKVTINIFYYTLATPFVGISLLVGQNSLYTTSLLLISLHFLNKKPIIAGLCFAILTYKPQFIILIPFALILTHHYKVLFYAGFFFLIQFIASILIFGFNAWVIFLEKTDTFWHLLATKTLSPLIMSSSFASFITFGISEHIAKLLSFIWFLIISSITLYIWYKRKADALAKAILVMGVCLASPYLFHYDTCIFVASVIFFIVYNNYCIDDKHVKQIFLFICMYIILFFFSISIEFNIMILLQLSLFCYFIQCHNVEKSDKLII